MCQHKKFSLKMSKEREIYIFVYAYGFIKLILENILYMPFNADSYTLLRTIEMYPIFLYNLRQPYFCYLICFISNVRDLRWKFKVVKSPMFSLIESN